MNSQIELEDLEALEAAFSGAANELEDALALTRGTSEAYRAADHAATEVFRAVNALRDELQERKGLTLVEAVGCQNSAETDKID